MAVVFDEKKKDHKGAVVVVKREVEPKWTFEEFVAAVDGGIGEARSNEATHTDKELKLLFLLPHALLKLFVGVVFAADAWGLCRASLSTVTRCSRASFWPT